MSKFFILFASVLFLLSAIVQVAHADEAANLATVQAVYDGEEWEQGRALAICVQTGLRTRELVGSYKMIFSFTVESVMTSRERFWGAMSFLLVDENDNMVAMALGQEVGETADELRQRAVGGDKVAPSGRYFVSTCETLTNTVVTFTPREGVKK